MSSTAASGEHRASGLYLSLSTHPVLSAITWLQLLSNIYLLLYTRALAYIRSFVRVGGHVVVTTWSYRFSTWAWGESGTKDATPLGTSHMIYTQQIAQLSTWYTPIHPQIQAKRISRAIWFERMLCRWHDGNTVTHIVTGLTDTLFKGLVSDPRWSPLNPDRQRQFKLLAWRWLWPMRFIICINNVGVWLNI